MAIEIEFDPEKDRPIQRKHGVPLSIAARLFANEPEIEIDEDHSDQEERLEATGFIEDRLFVCTFTWRGKAARIISLRKASRAEQRAYASGHSRGGRR